MRKLWLLLSLFGVLACRSAQEPTQTIVLIRAKGTLRDQIKTVDIAPFALPDGPDLPVEQLEAVTWPIERRFAPVSKSAFHRFKVAITARDTAGNPLTQFELESVVVDGVTRYVAIYLDEQCVLDMCQNGVCDAIVEAEGLSRGINEAYDRELYCEGGEVKERVRSRADGQNADMSAAPSDSDTATQRSTTTAGSTASDAAAADEVSTVPADGGIGPASTTNQPTQITPATDGACENNPCVHGTCGKNDAKSTGYDCQCSDGYELDEAQLTCVERNDCNKSNGGCDDKCAPTALGEAVCTCEADPNSWIKADGKQCSELQPEVQLSASSGSIKPTRPQVAFDSQGNGVAVWIETADNGVQQLWSTLYHADTKAWDSAFTLRTVAVSPAELTLALAPSGVGMLLWTTTSTVNSHRQLRGVTFRDGAFHLTAPRIDKETDADVLMPALAVDAAGDALIAWTAGSSLRALRYQVGTDTFGIVQAVPASDRVVLDPRVALDDANNGLITWSTIPFSQTPDAGYSINFAEMAGYTLRFEGRLGIPLRLSERALSTGSSDVVLDAQGRAVAIWLQGNDPNDPTSVDVVSGIDPPAQTWSEQAPQTLSTSASAFAEPRIAIGEDGSTVLTAWREWVERWGGSYGLVTRGALRVADTFDKSLDLGMAGDAPSWTSPDALSMDAGDLIKVNELLQPAYDLAVGPNQEGFVVSTTFDTSESPTKRQLWLQRVRNAADGGGGSLTTPLLVTDDRVADLPSPPRLAVNGNGEGAIVWDKQVGGHYFVVATLLQ